MSTHLLEGWLYHIKSQHRLERDLTLGRVREVAHKLGIGQLSPLTVIVAGTNGKGSTVAGLEKIWGCAGYLVGTFTSPWLLRFNEIVKIQGEPVSDLAFIQAFAEIEKARGAITLTQFEFNTLAACLIFQKEQLDIVILEVGLGGRLDAVNIIDCDVSVITSIALDHMDWLGETREAIAYEKAGIFRENKPIVCGEPDPPSTLIAEAKKLQAPIFIQGRDFGFVESEKNWHFWYKNILQEKTSREEGLKNLPYTALFLQNMATVLRVIMLMQDAVPTDVKAIFSGLRGVFLPGRIQKISHKKCLHIFDVSHNPAAADVLAKHLRDYSVMGKTRAVFSMLKDKDMVSTINLIKNEIDTWFVAPLTVMRAASSLQLMNAFQSAEIDNTHLYEKIEEAYLSALNVSLKEDRIVIFGSFYTVAAVMATYKQ